jgi:hypothetical protein
MKAVFCLTSAESKRLIAKAVANLPEVMRARKDGKVILAAGTTNVFVAEEILNTKIPDKWRYCYGLITDGYPCMAADDNRPPLFVIAEGKVSDIPFREAVKGMSVSDVFIKGANAIDPALEAGVLVAHENGGTLGFAAPYLEQSGAMLIMPVGLEKLIPSVRAAAQFGGIEDIQFSYGFKNRLAPVEVSKKIIITEIEALQALCHVHTVLMGAGGIGGSEGSVVLGISGDDVDVHLALEIIRSIKGEPNLEGRKQLCSDCGSPCSVLSWTTQK